jgi:hypothetical protein
MNFFKKPTPTSQRYLTALIALVMAMGMSSCVTTRYPVTPEMAAKLKPGEGFIVATFSAKSFNREGEIVSGSGSASVHVKGKASSALAILTPSLMPANRGFIMAGGGTPSEVVALPVPTGDYSITGWSIQDYAVTAGVTFMNRLPMDVPFHVKPGEATYVGRIQPVSIYGKNLFGMTIPAAAFVIITDEYAADAHKISKFYPSIRRSSIRKSNVASEYKNEMKRIAETPSKFLNLF